MSQQLLVALAGCVLLLHAGVMLFNVFGLVVVPLGRWRNWDFVRHFWWRALHLAAMGGVGFQAVLQRPCFLTIWQYDLLQQAGEPEPAIQKWIEHAVFWPIPGLYRAEFDMVVFAWVLLMWWAVPPRYPSLSLSSLWLTSRQAGHGPS
jgi:hypothetical protein